MIDDIDFKILQQLHKNSRLSNKQLADAVGLAPSSTLVRVKALQQQGVIQRFSLDINPKSLGVGIQAMLFIMIQVHSNKVFAAFHKYLESLQEVRALYHTTGKVDLLVHVIVKDSTHLRDFVLERISSREEVSRCETSLIYDEKRPDDLFRYPS